MPGCRSWRGAAESSGLMSALTNLQVQAVSQLLGLCVCVLDDLVWASQASPRCKGWPQCESGSLTVGYGLRGKLCFATWLHGQKRGPSSVSGIIEL